MPLIFILKRFHETHSLIPSHQVCFLFVPWNVVQPLDTLMGDPASALKGLLSGGGGEGKSFDKRRGNTHKAPANLESRDLLAEVRVTKGGTSFLAVEVAQRLLLWECHHSRSGLKQFPFHFFETRFFNVAETALEFVIFLPQPPPGSTTRTF